jgi:putative NADPH-quinone reductase
MENHPLVIIASARKKSDTRMFTQRVFNRVDHVLIDLLDHIIMPYNYENDYLEEDEFISLFEMMLKHEKIVFATPVYWYAMSGLLKNFFDRFTELITTKKHLGRQLKGKRSYLLVIGADKLMPPGFEHPFLLTSEYLDMEYKGHLYYSTKHSIEEEIMQGQINDFINKIY